MPKSIDVKCGDKKRVRINLNLSPSDLTYERSTWFTDFYGYNTVDGTVVFAIQKTNWSVALFKPYYSRCLIFYNPKSDNGDITLGEFFDNPSVRRARKTMLQIDDLRDERAERVIDSLRSYH